MQRPLPPLRSLQAFEAVVRYGGVSAAAARLGVTHGAVSKQVTALERLIGKRLFEGRPGAAVPTREAAAFARDLTVAFERMERAARTFTATEAGAGALTVLAPATFAMHWLMPRLRARGPLDGALRVRTTQTGEDWRGFDFDLAIRRDFEEADGLVARPLFAETLSLVARPDVGEALARRGRSGLAGATFLASESRPRELERWLVTAGVDVGQDHAPSTLVFDHFYVLLQAALDGLGPAVAPLAVLEREIAAGRLVVPFPDLTVGGGTYSIVTRTSAGPSRAVDAAVAWFVGEAGG